MLGSPLGCCAESVGFTSKIAGELELVSDYVSIHGKGSMVDQCPSSRQPADNSRGFSVSSKIWLNRLFQGLNTRNAFLWRYRWNLRRLLGIGPHWHFVSTFSAFGGHIEVSRKSIANTSSRLAECKCFSSCTIRRLFAHLNLSLPLELSGQTASCTARGGSTTSPGQSHPAPSLAWYFVPAAQRQCSGPR